MPSKRIEMWQRHAEHYALLLADLRAAYDRGEVAETIAAFDTEWGQIEKARYRILYEPGVDDKRELALMVQVLGDKLIRLRRPARELAEGAEALIPVAKTFGSVTHADLVMNVGAVALEMAEPQRAYQWFTDGIDIVRANYESMDPKEADLLLAKGLNFLGAIVQQLGDDTMARRHYGEALVVARRLGNEEQEGQIQGNLAVLMSEVGDNESAVPGYEQAIAVAKKYGDIAHVEAWTGNLANALRELGRYAEAENAAKEALSLARQLGDRREEGRRLGVLAKVTNQLGNAKLALEYQLTGYQVATELGDSFSQGSALSNLGEIYVALNQPEQALAAYEQATVRLNQADRPHLAARTAAAAEIIQPYARIPAAARAAVAKAEAGETASALDELAELLKTSQATGDSDLISTCLNHIGHVQMLLGRLTDAEVALRKAIELAPEGSELRAHEVAQLADVYQSAGDDTTAERLYSWVIDQPEAVHAGGRISGLALANLAAIATRYGKLIQARQLYTEALTKLRSAGAPELEQIAANLKAIDRG
jgi:tetratricopeptide (TPR) repeat protein